MIFPCDKCGICCRHIDLIPQLQKFDIGNGRCMYLTKDNLCSIYNERPDICNVSKMYELEYSSRMEENEYIRLNIEVCKQMKNKFSK